MTYIFLRSFVLLLWKASFFVRFREKPILPDDGCKKTHGAKVMFSPGKVTYKEELRNRSRPKFRQLSRDVSGEVFDIPEDHRVIFAYETLHGKTTLVGAICFKIADSQLTEPNSDFDSDFYHVIAFLFIKGDFQGQGLGRRLFKKAMAIMLSTTKRPIRVQSAERAVAFFERMGFVQVQPPFESMCGPRLFRFLYNMEMTVN